MDRDCVCVVKKVCFPYLYRFIVLDVLIENIFYSEIIQFESIALILSQEYNAW